MRKIRQRSIVDKLEKTPFFLIGTMRLWTNINSQHDYLLKFYFSHKNEILFLLILLFGLFVRTYDLAKESLWNDEAFSVLISNLSLVDLIKEIEVTDVNPPLFYSILHFWIKLFGDSEFSVRFPSLIFGVLSILLIYRLASLMFTKNVGLLSSLLLALSTFHIRYSQEARAYSLMVFFILLSFYFLFKLRKKKDFKNSIFYVVSTTLLIYTHYYGLIILLSQNLIIFLDLLLSKKRKELKMGEWLWLQFFIVIVYLPWSIVLIKHILRQQKNFWISEPDLENIYRTFYIYSGSDILPLDLLNSSIIFNY